MKYAKFVNGLLTIMEKFFHRIELTILMKHQLQLSTNIQKCYPRHQAGMEDNICGKGQKCHSIVLYVCWEAIHTSLLVY